MALRKRADGDEAVDRTLPRRVPRLGQPANDKAGSMAKAFDILEAVVAQPRPPTAAEVATVLGLPKPTGHRIVAALKDLGFLNRELNNHHLIEGARLVRLALSVISAAAQRSPRHSLLEALADETGETCNLGVTVNGQVIYVDRVETHWPLGLRFEPGSHVPIHCTAIGKMFLSEMPEKRRRALINSLPLRRYTGNTITDPNKLRQELERIRAEGVSTDDQEFMSGVVCVAVPVRGSNNRVCAGVAISAPEARLTMDETRKHLPALRETARRLSLTFELDGD